LTNANQWRDCPLCGNRQNKRSLFDKEMQYTYIHCPVCDLIYADTPYIPTPIRERQRYLEHDNTMDNDGYVKMLRGFLESAVLPFASSGSVLEFGCGPGPVLAQLLQQQGFEVDLYDPYFYCNQDWRNKEYDIITATEVFEHLSNPHKNLRQLCNVLKPDAILALMTHFHPGHKTFCQWWYRRDPTHISFYSKSSLCWIERNFPLSMIFSDDIKTVTLKKTPLRT